MEVRNLFHLLNNSYLLYINYSHTVIIIKVLMLSITINEWQTNKGLYCGNDRCIIRDEIFLEVYTSR